MLILAQHDDETTSNRRLVLACYHSAPTSIIEHLLNMNPHDCVVSVANPSVTV